MNRTSTSGTLDIESLSRDAVTPGRGRTRSSCGWSANGLRIEKIEGERPAPQAVVLIEWPSKEIADEFYASDEYRPYREARRQGARNEFLLLAGEDVNGVARIAD